VLEHKHGFIDGFSRKYETTMLVYYERHNDINRAICRGKRLKRWHRKWKLGLIESMNPCWLDLYEVRCAQGVCGRLDPGSDAGMT
jgi:putative endonuclease